jgi:hypothetical protein
MSADLRNRRSQGRSAPAARLRCRLAGRRWAPAPGAYASLNGEPSLPRQRRRTRARPRPEIAAWRSRRPTGPRVDHDQAPAAAGERSPTRGRRRLEAAAGIGNSIRTTVLESDTSIETEVGGARGPVADAVRHQLADHQREPPPRPGLERIGTLAAGSAWALAG